MRRFDRRHDRMDLGLGLGLTEDLILDMHDHDMFGAIHDPEQVPRAPTGEEEPVTELGGTRVVDLQAETPDVDAPVVEMAEDLVSDPLFDLRVDEFTDLEPEL